MKITKIYREYTRKESTGNYGSIGFGAGFEASLDDGEDAKEVENQLKELAKNAVEVSFAVKRLDTIKEAKIHGDMHES